MSKTDPVPAVKDEHRRSAGVAGDVNYSIIGRTTQFVEIELDPGESAIAEAGALMFKDTAVAMDAIFGDGSKTNSSFLSKVAAAGRRLVTGDEHAEVVAFVPGTVLCLEPAGDRWTVAWMVRPELVVPKA